MEARAGWLKGDLPEIGRGGRHAAVNAVIDGGLVSVLHVYNLVIIAESKKLYPSKQKALYAWIYILIGGQDPRVPLRAHVVTLGDSPAAHSNSGECP